MIEGQVNWRTSQLRDKLIEGQVDGTSQLRDNDSGTMLDWDKVNKLGQQQ